MIVRYVYRHCLYLFIDIIDLFFDVLLVVLMIPRWVQLRIYSAIQRRDHGTDH